MEVSSPRATVVVGAKGTAMPDLCSVYDVAHGAALVQIDPPALDRLLQLARSPAPPLLPPPEPTTQLQKQLMPRTEARATLFVLLNKLLQSQARIRPVIPIFIAEILNHFINLDLPLSEGNAGVSLLVVHAIYNFKNVFDHTHETDSSFEVPTPVMEDFRSRLWEPNIGELGITKDELETLEASAAAGPAIAALSVHLSSSICIASDAIAALSCEALQANTQAFEAETLGESACYKAENDVASDLRTLLSGSKLVNSKNRGIDLDFISYIPSIHGGFREDVKLASSCARVAINSASISRKKSSAPVLDSASTSPLSKSLLCVLLDMQSVLSYSFGRSAQVLQAIRDADTTCVGLEKDESYLLKLEQASHYHLESFKTILSEVVSRFPQNNYSGVMFSTEAYMAVKEARKVLVSESVVALALLHIRESILTRRKTVSAVAKEEKSIDHGSDNSLQNGSVESSQLLKDGRGKQVHDKKKKKSDREMVLGKGTSFARQSFMSIIQQKFPSSDYLLHFGLVDVVEEFLDPKNVNFKCFLDGLKVILESNEARRLPQFPKGTRDFTPEQMAIREKVFGIIASVFKRHGAVSIDTPVFELRETLMGKYGEDSKLIFDLADQGGQICSLRYDLTVPFARYLAMNSISSMKRYHIARVYRRDNPSKGRYREFYQCDFDIAGNHPSMIPDFEVIEVLIEMLDELDIGDYKIKLNHRGLLDGMLDICGVPKSKFRTICSAIDKLDKVPWELVRKEMIEEKGLTGEAADKIGEFVKLSGASLRVLEILKSQGSPFLEHGESSHALEELATLFRYLDAADCLHRVDFDLSLARGLDYYTGVIYEAVFIGSTQVGSIAAGGRYDNLVGMFSGKQVPAVGVSLGIERVFTIIEQKTNDQKQIIRATQTEVLVVVLGEDMQVAIKLVKELWTRRIKAEFSCVNLRKFQKQMEYALDKGIPWMIVVGNDELEKGVVRLQNLTSKQRDDIPRSDIVGELQKRLGLVDRLDFHPVFQ